MLARLWYLLEQEHDGVMPRGATKERMIWGLYLAKNYPRSDSIAASAVGGPDEKTYRKWAWYFIEELSYL